MSYKKMMNHQRTSIKKQKRSSYKLGIICSIPSDESVVYPEMTSNIEDYNTSSFTEEELKLATILMTEKGYQGQPKVVDITDLDRNLMAIDITIDKYKITVRQYSFGFSFGFELE